MIKNIYIYIYINYLYVNKNIDMYSGLEPSKISFTDFHRIERYDSPRSTVRIWTVGQFLFDSKHGLNGVPGLLHHWFLCLVECSAP